MKEGWRGIFSIAATPFDEQGELLFDDLAHIVDWIVRAGAHGVVWPVGHSEFTALSHKERMQGTEVAVETVAGRAPVIIGVSAQCRPEAVFYAERAGECGADGVIAMLPRGFDAGKYDLILAYYREIAEAAALPVFIQNQGPPWAGLPAETIVRLCRDIPLVEYVKEEKPPQTTSCQEILDICGDDMRGVFSGGGGSWLISEMQRGISGCFPGSPVTDIVVQVWNLWHDGERKRARELHNRHAAYMRIWRGMPAGARKQILVRRGVISTAFVRNEGIAELDDVDSKELDYALALLAPDFTV
ncbi:MAG: dihydrodipicolinate synthase family protein [Anaerolineae bacterium]